MCACNTGVRSRHEIVHVGGMPVIASRETRAIVEALLHDGPLAIRRDDERMQINLEPIGDAIVIDLGSETAGTDQGIAIQALAFRYGAQFSGCVARMPSASTANVQPEFRGTRIESPFERTDDGRSDPRRVPVHAHDRPESLKPIGIADPRKKRRMAIVKEDALDDRGTKLCHAIGEPGRYTTAMQWQVRIS